MNSYLTCQAIQFAFTKTNLPKHKSGNPYCTSLRFLCSALKLYSALKKPPDKALLYMVHTVRAFGLGAAGGAVLEDLEHWTSFGCILSAYLDLLFVTERRTDEVALVLGRLEAGQSLAADRLEEQESPHVSTDVLQVLFVHHLQAQNRFPSGRCAREVEIASHP